MNILVIEDNEKVSSAVKSGLEEEGHHVSLASDGENGYFLFSTQPFDLLVLDLMLPGRNGMEVLSLIRKQGSTVPVLILSARDSTEDRVEGLNAGADDYLVKPFAFSELLARIRALIRRRKVDQPTSLKLSNLEFDLLSRTVTRDGNPITLTQKELQLLEYLLRNQEMVVSREMLARDVWHETNRATPLDNVIDVHVARLRKKLDEPFEQALLQTVRGVGFVLKAPAMK